ncbi:sensor histidine kinase [Arthrobacter castelli]|uniref:sensor histidine kinase n=1 Tax=Arthrobacter castelli TaxID=271431 RepID=UPI0009D75B36|nr:HAMP domain-containing sensor histidine kinase [Arthrobacter castelli]
MTNLATRIGRSLASMRVRIVAVVVILLLFSSAGSVLLLRVVLFERLDTEIKVGLDAEAEEFQLLSEGTNPRTGKPFGNDLEALFDVYFSREVPDEGETLLAFIGGELYESRRDRTAAHPGQIQGAIDYWTSLEKTKRGALDTPAGHVRYVAIPVTGEPNDGLFVVANFPAYERSEIDDAVQSQIIVQAVTLTVASLLGLLLAGRVLRPLRSLATTARNISDTDLTRRIEVRGNDEASQIAASFNDMLGRLEQAFTAQRQFLDDTSHELRSPLTVIRGHIELIELDETAEDRAETVALVTDEIDRMDKIVSDLFLLARAEQPDFLETERVDLRTLIQDVHRKATALASRDWQLQLPAETAITADRHRITQAMLQLAENAVKFTGDDAGIQLGASVAGDDVVFWIQDTGPGVSTADAEMIFNRFKQGTSPQRKQGAGLGLSIVSAIAEAHGGSVRLASSEVGARFEMTIPRSG